MPKVSSKSGIGGKHFLQIIGVLSVLIIALGVGASVYLTSNKEQTTDNRGQAYSVQCEDGELHEAYFRGNKGYYRKYQLGSNNPPQFGQVVDLNTNPTALPGSGELRGQNTYFWTKGYISQSIVRGNQYWSRNVPITDGKNAKWNEASTWYDRSSDYTDRINLDQVQGLNRNTMELNGVSLLLESLWIGNKQNVFNSFWDRNVGWKFGNKVIALDLVAHPTAYPGTGDINAVAYYYNPKQNKFYESFIRGNVGYRRTATANNGQVNHSTYTQFTKFVDLVANPNQWPGTGTVQTYDAYILCR